MMSNEHDILINELVKLLKGGSAHASFDDAIEGLPIELAGVNIQILPYSIWQLVEHIRIAQWDMLEFSKDEKHDSPKWPEGYWVPEAAPADEAAWNKSIAQIRADRDEFIGLFYNGGDIYKLIPHGEGQSILREALQIADHNAYHTAEIIIIRRILGAWNS